MEAGGETHLGNRIADSLFLSFSEKMMKTAANKNHTDGAGECPPDGQEAWRVPLMSLVCFQTY